MTPQCDRCFTRMICIECMHPVSSLYVSYSPTNIRSTACPSCNKFADKYIEHDAVMVAIDLMLLRPQAFRHMVFNVLSKPGEEDGIHQQSKRMWLLITLFDVYLTWARAEISQESSPLNSYILQLPVLAQYCCFLLYCICETVVTHLVIRFLAQSWLHWTRPNALSTAVLISSSSKLFPILMLIWPYDIPLASTIVGWAVNFSMVEVLTTILGCGYIRATAITTASIVARYLVCDVLLARLIMLTS